MNEDTGGEGLDPETERDLRRLPRERRPPASLEDRVVEKLKAEGLLHPGAESRPPRVAWMRLAASIALLVAGFSAGAWWMGDQPARPAPPPPGNPRFLLLLHEAPGPAAAPSPEELRAVIDEYKTWAAEGVRRGFLLDGEKLKDGGAVLPESGAATASIGTGPSSGAPFIGGYFLIRASGYDEALRLARTCPHLKHGGVIEVREIDPV